MFYLLNEALHNYFITYKETDGFHPSQTTNVLVARWLWDFLETNHPDMLGDINPNNDIIQAFQGKDILTCDDFSKK